MALVQEKGYTVEDIYNLPDGERAELIDGQIYMMSTPSSGHQRIVHFLDRSIGNYVSDRGGDCEVFPAPFAVYLNNDDRTYLEPDLSIICDPDTVDDKGCKGAPDWIIEIVSPSTQHRDYLIKLFKYRTAGVREYWIVDQGKNRITVYNFENDTLDEYDFTESVKAGTYNDFEIDFSCLL